METFSSHDMYSARIRRIAVHDIEICIYIYVTYHISIYNTSTHVFS